MSDDPPVCKFCDQYEQKWLFTLLSKLLSIYLFRTKKLNSIGLTRKYVLDKSINRLKMMCDYSFSWDGLGKMIELLVLFCLGRIKRNEVFLHRLKKYFRNTCYITYLLWHAILLFKRLNFIERDFVKYILVKERLI